MEGAACNDSSCDQDLTRGTPSAKEYILLFLHHVYHTITTTAVICNVTRLLLLKYFLRMSTKTYILTQVSKITDSTIVETIISVFQLFSRLVGHVSRQRMNTHHHNN